MFIRYALVLVLLLTIAHSEVVVLGDDNITDFLGSHKHVMLEFYAPWCGHCKALAPQYEKLPQLVKQLGVQVAKVDATQAQKAAGQYNVAGYPTIVFVTNGVNVDYDGQRNAEGMHFWIKTMLNAKITTKTEEQITALLGTQNLVVLRSDKQDVINAFTTASLTIGANCYLVSSSQNTITLYTQDKQAKKWQGLTDKLNVKALKSWVVPQTMPVIISSSDQKYSSFIFNEYDGDLFLIIEGKQLSQEASQTLAAFCKDNLQIVRCMSVASQSQLYEGVTNFLKLQKTTQYALAFVKAGFRQAYTYTQNFDSLTEQSIKAWTDDIAAGKVQAAVGGAAQQIKYQQVSSLNKDNFDQYIKDNQYVFAEFYSPDCGHCKEFAKDYQKFAAKLNGENSQFKIAAVDAVANSQLAQKYGVEGYPTFKFFVNGKAFDYNGARSGTAMQLFMTQTINAKLQIAGSFQEVPSPAVVIYDSAEKSELTMLSVQFKRHPIYQIRQGDKIRVQFKGQKTQQYTGQVTSEEILKWLFKVTAPTLLDFATMQIDPVLSEAVGNKIPLLILVENTENQREQIQQQVTKLCKERKGSLVCGHSRANAELHDSILQWLELTDKTNNSIYYVSLDQDQGKFKYSKESVTYEDLKAFIEQSQSKKNQKAQQTAESTEQTTEKTQQTQQAEQTEEKQKQDKSETDDQDTTGQDL